EADDVVERLAVDGDARMARAAEMRDERAERCFGLDRLDVGARDHDVLDALFAQLQHVLQNRALGGGEIGAFAVGFAFERNLEIVAQRNRARREQALDALPEAWPPPFGGGGTRGRLRNSL